MIKHMLLIAILAMSLFSCNYTSSGPSRNESPDKIKKSIDIAKDREIIKQEISKRNLKWHTDVQARHPEWSSDDKDAQFALLENLWRAKHGGDEKSAIVEMQKHASVLTRTHKINSKLTLDDYKDIYRALIDIDQLHIKLDDLNKQFRDLQ